MVHWKNRHSKDCKWKEWTTTAGVARTAMQFFDCTMVALIDHAEPIAVLADKWCIMRIRNEKFGVFFITVDLLVLPQNLFNIFFETVENVQCLSFDDTTNVGTWQYTLAQSRAVYSKTIKTSVTLCRLGGASVALGSCVVYQCDGGCTRARVGVEVLPRQNNMNQCLSDTADESDVFLLRSQSIKKRVRCSSNRFNFVSI